MNLGTHAQDHTDARNALIAERERLHHALARNDFHHAGIPGGWVRQDGSRVVVTVYHLTTHEIASDQVCCMRPHHGLSAKCPRTRRAQRRRVEALHPRHFALSWQLTAGARQVAGASAAEFEAALEENNL